MATTSRPAATSPPDRLAPIASSERLVLLDVVRGFTLYGVLLANTVPWFSGRGFLPRAAALAKMGPADEVAVVFLSIFVRGKSQALLTFLFGLGFAIQLARADALGRSVVRLYLRRLAILFGIGVCHAAFVWWGDVVWGYALTGGGLLLFRRQSYRALVAWAIALVFVPKFVTTVPAVSAFLERIVPSPADRAAFNAEVLAACQGHDYVHLVKMQAQRGFYYFWGGAAEYIPWMLGHFLFGYAVGRSRVLEKTSSQLPTWKKLFAWSLAVGLVGGTASAVRSIYMRHGGTLSNGWKIALIAPEEIGMLAMALAYISALVLLMQKPSWHRRLIILAPAGQMALTTYLSQSVIMTFLFYGWGLGLMLRVGPALCVPLTLAVFGVQLAVAKAWLDRFQFGPVEWLWRSLTYGRRPRMRRPVPA